ncbi:hypothetical protein PM082_016621 [Marasmius tenuissimus]|nr:hypothetical protein PM082_016621 [Marasmius tenuissimus]
MAWFANSPSGSHSLFPEGGGCRSIFLVGVLGSAIALQLTTCIRAPVMEGRSWTTGHMTHRSRKERNIRSLTMYIPKRSRERLADVISSIMSFALSAQRHFWSSSMSSFPPRGL